jgi:RimJ/RimL family protein N-acetyltransferase
VQTWATGSDPRRPEEASATSAVQQLRAWAFQHTGLVRLELLIAAGNSASHRVAEKSGATREGMLRHRLLLHGARHDATMFSFIKLGESSPGLKTRPPSASAL